MLLTRELLTRTVVGIALIAFAIADLWAGGPAFWLFVLLVGFIMYYEWAGLAHADRRGTRTGIVALAIPLIVMLPPVAGPGWFAGCAIGLTAAGVGFGTRSRLLGFGIIYIALPVMALIWLRERPDGLMLALWSLAVVWMTDIGAYFAGRLIGGPKLAPAISPNKTWAGLAGGMVAALILGLVFARWLDLPLVLAGLSVTLAVAAQGGDLFESWLKRRAGVKDSGTILPGHGGVLDRLDGLVPAAPLAALFVAVYGTAP
ncbi:MAG: phosphatidate cytidylyltransferase [Sphingomonadaceae bacterium]